MELMYQAIYLLRTKYHFNGYIHVKAIPGTSDELITNMGYLVDRMSVNLELSTIDGLKKLAPHKNPKKLVAPIRQIQNGIVDHRLMIGKDASMERSQSNKYLKHTIFQENPYHIRGSSLDPVAVELARRFFSYSSLCIRALDRDGLLHCLAYPFVYASSVPLCLSVFGYCIMGL